MTSSEVSSPPLNESLDYGQPLELGNFLGLHARRAVAHTLEALERHLLAHLEYEERSIAATARRLPGPHFSNQVADSDLPAEEDQQ
jgi:hypothetical protein